jgi:hypothetical protein
MRAEAIEFFTYGALLAVIVLAVTWPISSSLLRLHLRAPFVALGLGFILVPGHGEFIAVPLLAMFKPPIHVELLAIGGVFFLIWWAVAVVLLLAFRAATASLQRA